MSRLKKEEVIQLYKIPNSMDPKAICKYSGFFTSIAMINKYISEGRTEGIITAEDDMVFEKRENERQEKAHEADNILYEQSLKKLLEFKSKEQIAKEISEEFHIKASPTLIGKMRQLAIKNGVLSTERYREIVNQTRINSIRESGKKRKEIKSKKEQEL